MMTKGEGCQKSQKIDDVLYERPQTMITSTSVSAWAGKIFIATSGQITKRPPMDTFVSTQPLVVITAGYIFGSQSWGGDTGDD